jgi:S-adenosylmethionine synthetase
MTGKRFFTSESVTEGHPDKMCDQISDAILDAILKEDKNARVACETLAYTGGVVVAGEISTRCYVDIKSIVRNTVREIGYTRAKYGFDGNTCSVLTSIDEQSPDIALGVDKSLESKEGFGGEAELGAGDQGMMFGYACDETPELMPAAHVYANMLTKRLAEARKSEEIELLRPDGKAQVTVEYDGDKVKRIDTVVVSSQHAAEADMETLREEILKKVILATLPAELVDRRTRYLINPTGKFVIGGPMGDSGLTGRKIIVDTYGGYCPHGGGALSGKDPTKVDRSALYMARYVCKNVVAAKLAKKCEIEVAYAIGRARPVSVSLNTFGTGVVSDEILTKAVLKVFDFRPLAIINNLDLRKPVYRKVANYGHLGRNDVTWEKIDKTEELKKAVAEIK